MIQCVSIYEKLEIVMTQEEALKILKSGKNIFLTGAAGAGKTYVLNQFIGNAKMNGKDVAITASTGIAATHLQGMTLHSWSGIGIKSEVSKKDIQDIERKANIALRYRRADILIIDEISMIAASVLDAVDQVARHLRKSDEPFGGMQVIFCGDFFQLPPISRHGEARFAFESYAWNRIQPVVCYLQKNYRQTNDSLLSILNAMRSNQIDEALIETLTEKMETISDDVYLPTKLFTHNVDVDKMNQLHLDRIEDKPKNYKMYTHGDKKFIESVKRGCLAPEKLQLKIGAVVMFVKNNLQKGYVNGTLGEVVDFNELDEPIIQIASGKEIVATLETWTIKDGEEVLAEISQIPLRLAWAITIHKSQGMSLDSAEIDLRKCFVPGMGYVALSRVRTFDGLQLKGFNQMALMVNQKILDYDRTILTS